MAITEGAADTSDLLLETEHVIESSKLKKKKKCFLNNCVGENGIYKRHRKYQEMNSLRV